MYEDVMQASSKQAARASKQAASKRKQASGRQASPAYEKSMRKV